MDNFVLLNGQRIEMNFLLQNILEISLKKKIRSSHDLRKSKSPKKSQVEMVDLYYWKSIVPLHRSKIKFF